VSPARTLLDAAAAGLTVELDGGDILLNPPEAVTISWRRRLGAEKAGLVEALASPRETAAAVWASAVEDVSTRWNALFAGKADDLVVWRDDLAEQERIGEALRAGDLAEVLRLAGAWRAAWLRAIGRGSSAPIGKSP
jgi:hypothetical protein